MWVRVDLAAACHCGSTWANGRWRRKSTLTLILPLILRASRRATRKVSRLAGEPRRSAMAYTAQQIRLRNVELFEHFKDELKRIATNPTPEERHEELDERARDVLEDPPSTSRKAPSLKTLDRREIHSDPNSCNPILAGSQRISPSGRIGPDWQLLRTNVIGKRTEPLLARSPSLLRNRGTAPAETEKR
jgi:hypothetical protein